MLEVFILTLFSLALILSVVLNFSILWALGAGLLFFSFYALKTGHSIKQLRTMLIQGILTAKNVLLVFILIGMLTASWRISGTLPTIVSWASQLISAHTFIVLTFLLNCFVSFLTGTSFGTAATMGTICLTAGNAMHLNTVLIGGAMLAGIYFGDRCSPVSTSALLISEITQTNIFVNIRLMLKTAAIPFIVSLVIYLVLGLSAPNAKNPLDLQALFSQSFALSWLTLLPVILILGLSLLRISVKWTMSVSILAAIIVSVVVQHVAIFTVIKTLVFGFQTENQQIAHLVNGGGIISMVKVGAIVCLASAFSGIFAATDLLTGLKNKIAANAGGRVPFLRIIFTTIGCAMLACNQMLTIIMTKQLTESLVPDRQNLAITLENTAVLLAPLIPWSIAGAVPIATVNAPTSSLFFAFFLYLVPLWQLLGSLTNGLKRAKASVRLG